MRSERKPRKERAPRERTRAARPTPPAPLPEGKGEKEAPRADSATESPSFVSPPPFREGGPGGVGPLSDAYAPVALPRVPVPHLVTGQKVDPDKFAFVKRLRDEMTPAERLLWEQLRASRLRGLHFRRQQLVHGYIADFYCHAAGVVVEVDGGVHDAQVEQDTCRDAAFAVIGLVVLRVRSEDVTEHLSAVLERIAAACAERLSEVHA